MVKLGFGFNVIFANAAAAVSHLHPHFLLYPHTNTHILVIKSKTRKVTLGTGLPTRASTAEGKLRIPGNEGFKSVGKVELPNIRSDIRYDKAKG